MTPPDDDSAKPAPASRSLAEALARKKAAAQGGPDAGRGGRVQNDRDAAARSAAKSKPPMRK